MKKVSILLLVLVMIMSVVLVGCSTKEDIKPEGSATNQVETAQTDAGDQPTTTESKEPVIVRAALISNQLALPFYYISEQGYDIENGFKLELSTFSSGPPVNEALGAGLWDIATIGSAASSTTLSVYDTVQIMSHMDGSGGINFYVRPDSEIAKVKGYNSDFPDVYGSPETVRGATFMLKIGSAHQLLLKKYLGIMGLEESDVNMVNMGTAEAYQAFVSGEADFAATDYPIALTYADEGYVAAATLTSVKAPAYDNVIVTRDFYENDRELLVIIVTQLLRVADEFKQNEDVFIDANMRWDQLNGVSKNREDIIVSTLSRPFFTVADYESADMNAAFKTIAAFYAEIGAIEEDALEVIFSHMKTDILEEAIAKYKTMY